MSETSAKQKNQPKKEERRKKKYDEIIKPTLVTCFNFQRGQ